MEPLRIRQDVIEEHLQENKPLPAAQAKMIWLINKVLRTEVGSRRTK